MVKTKTSKKNTKPTMIIFDFTEVYNNMKAEQERYLAERKKKRRNGWIAAGSIALNAVLIFISSR